MSKPDLRYDSATNTFRDAHGNILVQLPAPTPPPTNDLTQAIAAAFGYSPEAAPSILRVGPGGVSDEDAPSQAELDIAAAFKNDPETGA